MNVQSKQFDLGFKYFPEIKAKNIFFTNYNYNNNNSKIDYEDFLIPLRCALYVLDDKDEKKNYNEEKKEDNEEKKEDNEEKKEDNEEKKEDNEEKKEDNKENQKNVIKKRIKFSKNNNISNKKEKIEILNKYDKKEEESNKIEIDQSKIEHIIKKYNKFIDMILFIIEKNYEILNEKNICLMDLFNKYDKEKYFKMLCTKENDYIYWKQFGLEPPMIKISKLLDGKINIVNKNPYTIYLEKCK